MSSEFIIMCIIMAFVIYYISFYDLEKKSTAINNAKSITKDFFKSRLFWLIFWSSGPAFFVIRILWNNRSQFKDFQNLLVVTLGALPACVLWYYRDKAKRIDQDTDKENIIIAKTKLANEETVRMSTLIARISDEKTPKTERVYIAYQLSESLPEDKPEDGDIIKILEIFRSLIDKKNTTDNYLINSIQNILIKFMRARKYRWYRFEGFNFARAIFFNLDLSGYKFVNCIFKDCTFTNIKFNTSTNITKTGFSQHASWIDYCDFRKAKFEDVSFKDALLMSVDFSGCAFDDSIDFTNAKIRNSKFNKTTLSCNFTGVEFDNIEFFGTTIYDDIVMDKNVKGIHYNIESHDNKKGYNMKHNFDNDKLIYESYEPCCFQSYEDCDRHIDNNKELERLLGHSIEHNYLECHKMAANLL